MIIIPIARIVHPESICRECSRVGSMYDCRGAILTKMFSYHEVIVGCSNFVRSARKRDSLKTKLKLQNRSLEERKAYE